MSTIEADVPKSFENLFDQAGVFVEHVEDAIEEAQKSEDFEKNLKNFLAGKLKNLEDDDFFKVIKKFASPQGNFIGQKAGAMKIAAGRIIKILNNAIQSCPSLVANELCKANVSSALSKTYEELKKLESKNRFKDQQYDKGR